MNLATMDGITQLLLYLEAQHLQSLHSPQLADLKLTELVGDSVDESTLKSLPLRVPPHYSGAASESLSTLLGDVTHVMSATNSTGTVFQIVDRSRHLTTADVADLDCYIAVVQTRFYTGIGILPYMEIDSHIKPYPFLYAVAATVPGCTPEMIASKVGSLLAQHHPRDHHALVN